MRFPGGSRIRWAGILLLAVLGILLLGRIYWYSPARHHAVPRELQIEAHVPGFPEEVRYFPRDPGDIKLIEREFVDSWAREKAFLGRDVLPPTAYLALSGGGDKGAFSAGFLNGWSRAGTRPA